MRLPALSLIFLRGPWARRIRIKNGRWIVEAYIKVRVDSAKSFREALRLAAKA